MSDLNISKEDFDKIMENAEKPIVIDFWATWCAPCKMFAPIFEEVAKNRDDFIFVKIDVDQEKELASKFRIRSIPTIQIVDKNNVLASKSGVLSKDAFNNWLNANK